MENKPTIEELLIQSQNKKTANAADLLEDITKKERVRTTLQGVTLGSADEIEAALRTLGGDDYGKSLSEIRDNLRQYKDVFPKSSTAFEVGGAMIPALFSRGKTLPQTLKKASLLGAAEGGAYGFATGEGGFKERVLQSVPSAMAGMVLNPLSQKIIGAGSNMALRYFDSLRRKFGHKTAKAVEDEVNRLVSSAINKRTGNKYTIDEAIEEVAQGKVLADLTPVDTRAVRAESSEGGAVIDDALVKRRDLLRGDASSQIQEDLTGTVGNVQKAVLRNRDKLLSEESSAYNAIWKKTKGQPISKELQENIIEILTLEKSLRDELAKDISTARLPKLFSVDKNNAITLLREPDLKTAEIIRRGLNDLADAAGKNRKKSYLDLENEIRENIDNFSPDLKTVRRNWAEIMAAKDAYDNGKLVFTRKTVDDVEIEFEKLVAEGTAAQVAAYRQGVGSTLRAKSTTGSGKSLMTSLDDITRKERKILEIVYPEDKFEDAVKKINLAATAQQTKNVVVGGSPTAITEARRDLLGSAGDLADIVSALRSGGTSIGPVVRIVKRFLGRSGNLLTNKQKEEVARLLVAENPDVLINRLQDRSGLASLQGKIAQLANIVKRAGGTGATVGVLSNTETLKNSLLN
tara:strand:- start:269 stop:2167 length:1899 start_codon:yes stop_codon:yes gene_type:complete